MAINIFGFTIARQSSEEPGANDVVAPDSYDGSYNIESGSIYGGFLSSYTDFSGSAKTEEDFIKRYRTMSLFPEVDQAIEDIGDEWGINDKIMIKIVETWSQGVSVRLPLTTKVDKKTMELINKEQSNE